MISVFEAKGQEEQVCMQTVKSKETQYQSSYMRRQKGPTKGRKQIHR